MESSLLRKFGDTMISGATRRNYSSVVVPARCVGSNATGGGNQFAFNFQHFLQTGLTLVVSLVALMENQVKIARSHLNSLFT